MRLWASAWLALAALAVLRHYELRTGTFELGAHHQAAWLLSHGYRPWLSLRGAPQGSPLTWLFAVPLWLVDSEVTLLALQSAWLAGGVLPVYGLARRRLSHGQALGAAALYLVQPGLLYLNQSDVSFAALAVPFGLWAAWALEEGWAVPYGSSLAMLLSTGGSAGLALVALAGPAARLRGWRWGAATLGAGLLGLGSVATPVFPTPAQWGTLLIPLLGLPLLSPLRLLPALACPGPGALPFLTWAAIDAWGRWRSPGTGWSLAVAGVLALMLGPLASWDAQDSLRFSRVPPLPPVLVMVQEGDSLSTDERLGAHLSANPRVFLWPNPFQTLVWGDDARARAEQTGQAAFPASPGAWRRAVDECPIDHVILRLKGDPWPLNDRGVRRYALEQFLLSGDYGVEFFDGDVLALKRGGSPPPEVGEILRRL